MNNPIPLIKALAKPDQAMVTESVNGWLDNHPEATTTVEDGSITKVKLDATLKADVDSIPAINAVLPGLENASTFERTSANWEIGSRKQDGSKIDNPSRLRTTKRTGKTEGALSVRALFGYEFAIYAYSENGVYYGIYCTDDTFKTSGGTIKWTASFDFASRGDGFLQFDIVLRNAISPTSEMSIAESDNCIFLCNTDTNLLTEGRSADARATGRKISLISESTRNLFDVDELPYSRNSDGYISRTALQLKNDYGTKPGLFAGITFKENTQYAVSMTAYTNGSAGTTGNGIQISINYTDGSEVSYFRWPNSAATPSRKSVVSSANKTISYISIDYGTAGGNTWYIKDIQIEEGVSATEYIPYMIAYDAEARKQTESGLNMLSDSFGIVANLLNKMTIAKGKVASGNGAVTYDNDVRVTDYIPIKELTKYILVPEYNSSTYGIAYYDSSKTYLSGRKQSLSGQTRVVPLVIITPENAAYIRFNIWYTHTDEAGLYEYSDKTLKDLSPTVYTDGKSLEIYPTAHSVPLCWFDYSTYGRPQSGDVFGNKLFCFGDNLLKNFVIDLETFAVSSVAYSGEALTNHANNASFGAAYYDENDAYPVIYISSQNGAYCGIYRIIESEGVYTITEISKINYPAGEYIDLTVDVENSLIYLRGNIDNALRLVRYYLPTNISEDVSLEYVQYDTEEHPYGYLASVEYEKKWVETGAASDRIAQDSFIANGKYYTVGGYTNSQNMNVYDLSTGKLISFANLTSVIDGEPEVCAMWHNAILVSNNAGRVFFIQA